MKNKTVRDLTHIAIVAALYVVLTVVPPFNLISYGPYQFRIAEMFNLLGFYNRKYIIAVTLGCVIANFLIRTAPTKSDASSPKATVNQVAQNGA